MTVVIPTYGIRVIKDTYDVAHFEYAQHEIS